MISRLHNVNRALSEALTAAGPTAQRHTALAVLGQLAAAGGLIESGVLGDIAAALIALQEQKQVDSLRAQLQQTAAAYEAQAAEAEYRIEDGGDSPDPADLAVFEDVRRQQCAALSAYFALDTDPDTAAQESAYEARFVFDKDAIDSLVREAIAAT